MKTSRLACAVAIVALAVVMPMPAAAGTATLAVASADMDASNVAGWWTPLDTYIGTSEHAYLAANIAHTTGTHTVSVRERITSGGVVTWVNHELQDGGTAAVFENDLGHAQPSVARDGNGDLHVFAGMHTDPWRYFRSSDDGPALENESAEMPDAGSTVTYPILATAPNGDVYLAARVDELEGGEVVSRSGRLYRWDVSAQTWSAEGVFAQESGKAVYPDDIQIDVNGDVHILYSWSRFPSSGFRHELSYIVYQPSSTTFVDSSGSALSSPATTSTSDRIQELEGAESYAADDYGVQTAKLTLENTEPRVVYRYRSDVAGPYFEVTYAETSGAAWSSEVVYSASETRAAVDITWHPTNGARVYYVLTSGADRVFAATRAGSAWTSVSVADGLPVERLAVERSGTKDILYLVDVTHTTLYYGRN